MKTIYINATNYNPNSGRIRRALKLLGGAIFGTACLFALMWAPAVLCIGLGYGPEVCGL